MDELGRLNTPIHRLDARIKILTTLAFIIVVMSFPRDAIAALTPFAAYPLFLLIAGTIPLKDIAKKIAVAAPFALVIGIFNPIIDHTPALTYGSLVITQGWLSFTSIMLRFLLTVSAALALVATTGMYRIGVGLEQLGIPRVFIMQILFLYRYLFVVSEEALTLVRSVSCRSPSLRAIPLRTYGSLTGQLLLRSMDRAERIHRAMALRGFDGHIRSNAAPRITGHDLLFFVVWIAFITIARMVNLADAMGSVLV
jgi:cobalt/nickel transport system permease protein